MIFTKFIPTSKKIRTQFGIGIAYFRWCKTTTETGRFGQQYGQSK